MSGEGIVSKRINTSYTPGKGGLWLKTKCLNREEFVVVGLTDPEGLQRYRLSRLSSAGGDFGDERCK
jgi:ATP-dependent DNA ligase